jgi:hypothetical protein
MTARHGPRAAERRSRAIWSAIGAALTAVLLLAVTGLPPLAPVLPARAQEACPADVEPNDEPDGAPTLVAPFCVEGELLGDDTQDLWAWEIGPDAAARTWTFTLEGVPDALTSLRLLPIESEPGVVPATLGNAVFQLDLQPGDEPVRLEDRFVPAGRHVLAVFRSPFAFGEPAEAPYRLSIEAGTPLPPSGDREPNDDQASAVPVTDAFALSGDQAETTDVYAWTVGALGAEERWEIEARVQSGSYVTLELRDATARSLVVTDSGRSGIARLPDLALAPGTYFVSVSYLEPGLRPYVLSARKVNEAEEAVGDAEPNDAIQDALPLALGTLASGRLGHAGDRDAYLLDLDAAAAATQIDIKLLAPGGPGRTLCLAPLADGAPASDLQCATADGGVVLRDLFLPAGQYRLEVRGDADPAAPYHLRIDTTSRPAPDYETEPNDTGLLATGMDSATVMRGRLHEGDRDAFRVRIDGDLQLWEAVLEAEAGGVLSWIKADGTQLARNFASADAATLLTDLLLAPGEHWFEVQGAGDYQLRLAPLGPPDPNGEREPNDTATFAEPLLVGQERVGRLSIPTDRDVSRLSLASTEHVRFRLEPPADAGLELGIEDAGGRIFQRYAGAPGEPVEWEALLPAGDYEIWIGTRSPVNGRYRLRVDRLDPFTVATDREPNDVAPLAAPMPGSLQTTGSVGESDDDWYVLPPLPAEGSLAFRLDETMTLVANDGTYDLALASGTDAGSYSTDPLPAGTTVRVRVSGRGPYELSVDPGTTGLAALADPPPAAFEVGVELEPRVPAAWWPEGQRLEGSIVLTNPAQASAELTLDAVASHPAFRLELPAPPVTVPAGEALEVPIAIAVTPDAWADIPVRLTVRAMAPDGSFATGHTEVVPGRDVEPVRPGAVWPVPEQLLGGLDVAAKALGASVVAAWDPAGEERLHDGFAPVDGGLQVAWSSLPVALTVDLAGDAAVPVAGTIIDVASAGALPAEAPRAFALLLSEDGVTYEQVLEGELSAQPGDQPFVLPSPVPARFAQLRIDSTWQANGRLTLGEWKVVAQPESPLEGRETDVNIADPAVNGHVAWIAPQLPAQAAAEALLSDDGLGEYLPVPEGGRPAFAIGFRDARTAEIERLEWVPQPGADPARSIGRVNVAVSTDGAAGPWRDVGDWSLEPGPDGASAPYLFDAPVPARYVRLTGEPREADDTVLLPATVRVVERAPDATYRSILGEWGGSSRGPLEWREALVDAEPELPPPDAPDVPEEALPLGAGEVARGTAHRGRDVDWYALGVPDRHQSLRLTLRGVPAVGTALTLVDESGAPVPTIVSPGAIPGSVEYATDVVPGGRYRVRVDQPPFSAVVAYDTSMSMGPYLPVVYGAVRSYAQGVEEGAESVLIQPFEEDPLLEEWSDQTFVIQDAVNRYVNQGSSSSAETGLIDAIEALWTRPGTRAVLVMTDAETSSYQRNEELWSQFGVVRPVIYAVQVGPGLPESRHFMQDWAAVGGGHYEYARSHAEVDRAFDRMATRLRRPANYLLSYETSVDPLPPPEPARLSVVAEEPAEGSATGASAGAPSPDVAVALVLDTSGSMLKRFGDRRRIDVAKEALAQLVTEALPPGTPVSLRVFRQVRDSCETELASPLAPLVPEQMGSLIEGLGVKKSVATPLAAAIEAVISDLEGVTGPRSVVVVSDGQESCDGDPEAAMRALTSAGFDVTVNIVGLDLDRKTRKRISQLAELGNGTYFDATDPTELARVLAQAVSAPVQVFDATERLVATGTVGGGPIELPPGSYRVVVLADPQRTYEGVVLEPGGSLTLSLAAP